MVLVHRSYQQIPAAEHMLSLARNVLHPVLCARNYCSTVDWQLGHQLEHKRTAAAEQDTEKELHLLLVLSEIPKNVETELNMCDPLHVPVCIGMVETAAEFRILWRKY